MKVKHIIGPPLAYSLVFFLLYSRLLGVSGGDILLGMTSVVFLVGMTLIIGLITFSWKFNEKLRLILGIICSFILALIYHTLLL